MFSTYWGHQSKMHRSPLWHKTKWGTRQWSAHPTSLLSPTSKINIRRTRIAITTCWILHNWDKTIHTFITIFKLKYSKYFSMLFSIREAFLCIRHWAQHFTYIVLFRRQKTSTSLNLGGGNRSPKTTWVSLPAITSNYTVQHGQTNISD